MAYSTPNQQFEVLRLDLLIRDTLPIRDFGAAFMSYLAHEIANLAR